jgi:Spy/CpxP family protein refolding chaperone
LRLADYDAVPCWRGGFEMTLKQRIMKISKPMILASLIGGAWFAGGGAVQAQNSTNPPAGPPPAAPRAIRANASIDRLAASLKLDDDTKAKVKAILDEQQNKGTGLMADTALSPTERRDKIQALREDTAKKMKAILTPAQFDQWEQMSQPRQRRAAPPPPDAPQK